jgi:hypothetical protein
VKIFLSWSGPQSRAVAEALNDWLPRVIQAVRVFFSPDIEKGAKWSGELDDALEGTSFGIVCITPQNLTSPWIHYEAGALSKLRDARVWTFLLDLTPGDVGQPLGRFQHTVAEKADVMKLVRNINTQLAAAGGTPLADRLLDEVFDDSWPRLNARLQEARGMAVQAETVSVGASEQRTERAMLEEMLELLREQQRRFGIVETLQTGLTSTNTARVAPEKSPVLQQRILAHLRIATRRFLSANPMLREVAVDVVGDTARGLVFAVLGSGHSISDLVENIRGRFAGLVAEADYSKPVGIIRVLMHSPVETNLLVGLCALSASEVGLEIENFVIFVDAEPDRGDPEDQGRLRQGA